MEKNEHAIFLDIPGGRKNGKFHSAILTTYSIDLIHFDNQLLNMLHRKLICSINVFADLRQVDSAMEFVSPMYIQNLGKEYSITNINSEGVFHPKINFFIGDDTVLVVFGSGNLTVSGHGKNHEVFSGLMIDDTHTAHRPLIEECWRYLCKFTKQCSDFDRNRILREIPENCTFLDSSYKFNPHRLYQVQDGLEAALVYNDSRSGILQQISRIVPVDEVKTVTVLSPFFDERGETLVALSELCPNSKINVLIHKDCELPPSKMRKNDRINFYDFSETRRGKMDFKTYHRKLHAKILHFKTKDYEYCVIGSANATKAGFGTLTYRGINEEFGVLYRSKTHDFLTELGLKTKKRIDIPVSRMNFSSDKSISNTNRIRILCAQYEGKKLSIRCETAATEELFLAIDNGMDCKFEDVKFENSNESAIDIILDKDQYICYLVNRDKVCVSNKVFLYWTELLATTNPSIISRNLNRFISRIENVGYNGMEIVDMLSDVMWDLMYQTRDTASTELKMSSITNRSQDVSLPKISYNPDYDNDDSKSSSILHIDRTSRLIECIEESIRKKIRSINDSLYDEEEEGSAETSNLRTEEVREDIYVSKKEVKGYGEVATSLLMKYQRMIDKRYEQIRSNGTFFITKDDLNFFSLTMFTVMEICWLNRSQYKFDQIEPIKKSEYQKQFYDSLDRSISSIGRVTLEKFVKFCSDFKTPELQGDDYKNVALRAMKYAILYGSLFEKFRDDNISKNHSDSVLKAIKSLASIFGEPSMEYLKSELEPLSKRYDYAFRMGHIENLLRSLN